MARDPYDKVRREPKRKSTWDPDVDYEKVLKLPPQERFRLFPDEFNSDGSPRGDF